jgi:hypothetical protein
MNASASSASSSFNVKSIKAHAFMILSNIIESLLPISLCSYTYRDLEAQVLNMPTNGFTLNHVIFSFLLVTFFRMFTSLLSFEYTLYLQEKNESMLLSYMTGQYVINMLCYSATTYLYFNIEHYMSYSYYSFIWAIFYIAHLAYIKTKMDDVKYLFKSKQE